MKKNIYLFIAIILFNCSSDDNGNNSNDFSLDFNKAFIDTNTNCLGCENDIRFSLLTSGLQVIVDNNVGVPDGNGEVLQFVAILTDDGTGTYTFTNANPFEQGQLISGRFYDNYIGEEGAGTANQYGFDSGTITIIDNGDETATINYNVDLFELNDFESVGSISGSFTGNIEFLEILF